MPIPKLVRSVLTHTLLTAGALLGGTTQAQVSDDAVALISVQVIGSERSEHSRPPNIAIWIETSDGRAVSTIDVWFSRHRALPNLERWWEAAGSKYTPEQLAQKSSPRRPPGSYVIEWNGTADDGTLLEPQAYWLWVEASGDRDSIERVRVPIQPGAAGSSESARGERVLGEIRALVLEARPTPKP